MGPKQMIQQFSFAQMVSNSSGKTSSSGVFGCLICAVGCLGFLAGVVDAICFSKNIEIIGQSILMVGIGAGLLGYRKSKGNEDLLTNDTTTPADVETGYGDYLTDPKDTSRVVDNPDAVKPPVCPVPVPGPVPPVADAQNGVIAQKLD